MGGGSSKGITSKAAEQLHKYTNEQLGLRALLIERMGKLSPAEFEQVLHPIFKQDEIILIAAGGVLGFLAGGAQWWLSLKLQKRKEVSREAV